MAKTGSTTSRGNGAMQNNDVPEQMVTQVGKAVAEIIKLRDSLQDDLATAQTEEARQNLANQVETAAVRAISEQGLTVDQYNRVITAAQEDSDLQERVLVACRAA